MNNLGGVIGVSLMDKKGEIYNIWPSLRKYEKGILFHRHQGRNENLEQEKGCAKNFHNQTRIDSQFDFTF